MVSPAEETVRRGRAPAGSGPARRHRGGWLLRLAVLATTLLFLAPVGYLTLGALRLGPDLLDILGSPQIRQPLANSLLLAAATAVTTAVLGTALAVLVSRTDVPGRRVWRVMLPLPLVIPSFVGATALIVATGPGGIVSFVPRPEGFWGAYVVLTVLTYPYVYLPVLGRLSATSGSLEEVSRLLGRGSVTTVLRVLLPQLRDAVLGGALLVFLYVLSDFGAVALLRYDTITRVIYSSRLLDRGLSLTLGLVLGVLALLVALLARSAQGRGSPPAARSSTGHTYHLGLARYPTMLLVASPVLVGLVAPIVVFVIWVVRGSSTIGVGYSGWGDDLSFLVEPLAGSTLAAVVAAAVAVLVVLPVAFASVRRPSRSTDASAAVVASVFALPGLVVALAIVAWAVAAPSFLAPLYQSFPLLVLGYVLHFGVQSLRSSQAGLAAVPPRLDEAAAVLGAGGRRRFLSVDVPLVLPALLAGGGLVLLSTLKELPITLLLSPVGYETLATTIWSAAEEGFYAEVGVTSLVLIALSALLTWALVLRRGPSR